MTTQLSYKQSKVSKIFFITTAYILASFIFILVFVFTDDKHITSTAGRACYSIARFLVITFVLLYVASCLC